MDLSIILGIIAAVVGVVAGTVQILDYIHRKKKPIIETKAKELPPATILTHTTKNEKLRSNLPSSCHIIGRDKEIRQLKDLIDTGHKIIMISGVAGIGKTSIALSIAYDYIKETTENSSSLFPNRRLPFDAFIWTTSKANPISLVNFLDIAGKTLDYPYISSLKISEKYNEVVTLLAKHKALIVLDNYETVQDPGIVPFLNDLPKPSQVLITTRQQKYMNVDSVLFALDKLTMAEGIALMESEFNRVGISNELGGEDNFKADLYNATGGSPLAIKWAVGQLKQSGQSTVSILSLLRAARGDVFETMFSGAWERLSKTNKKILLSMPIFAATVSRDALQFISDPNTTLEFDEAIGQLTEMWLLESNREAVAEKQRFGVHPLTRAYSNKELLLIPNKGKELRWRSADYFLSFCRERRNLQKGLVGYNEIQRELANIQRILDWLEEPKDQVDIIRANRMLIDFADAINVFLWSRGYWGDRVKICSKAIEASNILKDWSSAGRHASFIGIVRFWQSRFDEADQYALLSDQYMRRSNNPVDRALATRLMGLVLQGKAEYDQALANHLKVLKIIRDESIATPEQVRIFADWICLGTDGHKAGIIALLEELGIISFRKGDYDSALKWLLESKELAEKINDIEGLSVSLSHLGHTFMARNQVDLAKEMYTRGLKIANQVQRKSSIGRCQQGLADVASSEGKISDLLLHANEALDIFDRLGMREEYADVKCLIGKSADFKV